MIQMLNYCKYSFCTPLCLFIILASIIYIGCLIKEAIRLQDPNYESSLIRDKEDIRMAKIRTLISYWFNGARTLPFQYKSDQSVDHSKYDYNKLENPPGITVAILAPNRISTSRDAYETFYLTNSVVSFMNASYYDLSWYGNRFSFVNLTVCLTDDHPSKNKELLTIKQLLGAEQIKYRPKLWASKSLSCRTVLDAGSCLLRSVEPMKNTYIILIEDDLIPDYLFFKHLWDTFVRLDTQQRTKRNPPGLIQLYIPESSIHFSPFDFSSWIELSIFSIFLTFLLVIFYLRLWWRPFFCFYNVVLIVSTFCTSVFILCLIGRLNLLSLVHRTLNLRTISVSSLPKSVSTGAAALISSEQAVKLGKLLQSVDCDSYAQANSPIPPKASLIYDYLTNEELSVWSIFPSLVKHYGLYSIYNDGMPNPFKVD